MSRSGYSEDCDNAWDWIRWRGVVASASKGRRGQAFFRDMAKALDAMPEKRLIPNELRHGGEVCALGSLGAARGVNLADVSPDDHEMLGALFDIAAPLVQEVEYMNDEGFQVTSPEERWAYMRKWVRENLRGGER